MLQLLCPSHDCALIRSQNQPLHPDGRSISHSPRHMELPSSPSIAFNPCRRELVSVIRRLSLAWGASQPKASHSPSRVVQKPTVQFLPGRNSASELTRDQRSTRMRSGRSAIPTKPDVLLPPCRTPIATTSQPEKLLSCGLELTRVLPTLLMQTRRAILPSS